MKSYDLIVIGAGAAGLSAAIAFLRRCGEAGGTALAVDRGDEPGKKILVTGNGRCNLSNTAAPGWDVTREFFGSLGVLLDTDAAGRVYPLNRQAAVVRDALVCECERLGCGFMSGARVTAVSPGTADDFVVSVSAAAEGGVLGLGARRDGSGVLTDRGGPLELSARQVIVATGGKARPAYGNYGDGYGWARALGISVEPIRPALVPLVYTDGVRERLSALAGVRARARVELLRAGEVLAESEGEVQFARDGLSGICVFDLSRSYGGGKGYAVRIDFAAGYSESEVAEILAADRAAGLAGIVHEKIAEVLGAGGSAGDGADGRSDDVAGGSAGDVAGCSAGDVADGSAGDVAGCTAALVKCFEIPVKGTKGWKDAQITAGGISLDEVDPKHFESKAVPGLYFVGEILDYDGPSGGFNLDYAWNTGLKAGRAAGAYCSSYLSER